MDLDKVEKFIDLAKKSGLSNLTYEKDDEKISISFAVEVKVEPARFVSSEATHTQFEAPSSSTRNVEKKNYTCITSPFVGTFYRSASPESDPYAKVGDRVSPGQVLCIVEAMKIMNEIESEISGEIVEICVENENYVEFGQTLFKIKP